MESYLSLDLKGSDIKRIAQLRTISTNLTSKLGDTESTVKSFATGSARTAQLTTLKHLTSSWNFLELPFPDPIIEDELHVLRKCLLYEDLRHKLSQQTKTYLFSNISRVYSDAATLRDIARFLTKVNNMRFSKKAAASSTKSDCVPAQS